MRFPRPDRFRPSIAAGLLAGLVSFAALAAPPAPVPPPAPAPRAAPEPTGSRKPASPADILERAIAAQGGEPALAIDQFRLVFSGRSFPGAVDQGFSPDENHSVRLQESLVHDVGRRSAARRWESENTDGSPTLWREGVVGERGYRMNLKTGRRWPATQGLDLTYDNLTWRVPALALRAMRQGLESLRPEAAVEVGGRAFDALAFPVASAGGKPVTVLFDRATGLLAGYQYPEDRMLGRLVVRTLFKPYARYALGRLPGGYTLHLGESLYLDLDLLDARPGDTVEDPWFTLPEEEPNRPPVVMQQPSTTTEVFPGLFMMRNVGGYNTLFADLGDCVAVLDAIASYQGGTLLPPAGGTADLAARVLDQVKTSTGKPVCYVVPTHHHGDHFGGIGRFAAAGATVVTSPGNERLARRTLEAQGAGRGRIELVRDRRVLGSGKNAMQVWLLRGPHVEEMLFVYFPEHRLMFEGDLTDYTLQAVAFMRFLDEHPLTIETILSVHGSRPYTMDIFQFYEPGA